MEDAVDGGVSALSKAYLIARITELAGHLNAANHRWLVLIAEFDRRQGWADGFTRSCAHWLNWKCGLDLGAGREKVRRNSRARRGSRRSARLRPFTHRSVIAQQNAAQGLQIEARTAATRWGGERMDYGIAIDALLYRTRRAAEQQRGQD